MTRRYEVRIAGIGGQGVILAGVILAEAAVGDGMNAVQTQSYGPEARGGASRSEVIIADEEIHYPQVLEADIMLCMSQEACDRYSGRLRKGGLLILDADQVTRAPTTRAVRVSMTKTSEDVTGKQLSANMVGLAILAGLTGIVSRASLEKAVCAKAPRGTADMNRKALAAGYDIAKKIKENDGEYELIPREPELPSNRDWQHPPY
jgi:2-oxoglutarate ferredoxin oxidoreductase subunit gamma